MEAIKNFFRSVDWLLFLSVTGLSLLGLVTMNSFIAENTYFERQLIWLIVSVFVLFGFSKIEWRFLRRTEVLMVLFFFTILSLGLLFIFGSTFKGAQSWYDFGFFSFQPSDPAKIILILILSKYFSRRHIEIAHIRHIIVSGIYAFIFFALVFFQPDFGTAIIIFCIWFGMVMISGISRKHLIASILLVAVVFACLWVYVFADFQKDRILTFLHPLADTQGAGYNAYQSTITVGSGQFFGKGIGYGTQSRLQFLPEYQTDFIFAAFAEEWGFVGVLIVFGLYGLTIWRILSISRHGETNFEILFGVGLVVMIVSHFTIHVGMNIGLLPVTGITIPFMSYGGTSILTLYAGLGILMGMKKYSRAVHKDIVNKSEYVI